jgi:hypothetical protein
MISMDAKSGGMFTICIKKQAKHQMEWNDSFRQFDRMELELNGLTSDVQDM